MTSTAVIWFMVKVPVLSELMAEVKPSVSTDGRSFTMAFRCARSRLPRDRITCVTVGSASGIAAIASETALTKSASHPTPRPRPRTNITNIVTPAAEAIHTLSRLSSRVSGDCSRTVDDSIPEIRPSSVSLPVPVTIAVPLPCVTGEFMNAMLVWSPGPRSSPERVVAPLLAGVLSPVRADSSICSALAATIRTSAGTWSPAASVTMSPTTTSRASISDSTPSRCTLAVAFIIDLSAFMALSALPSCRRPTTALSRVSRRRRTAVVHSWMASETTAAPDRISCMKLRYSSRNLSHGARGFSSGSSFGPPFSRRSAAAPLDRPTVGSTPRVVARSSAGQAYQAVDGAAGEPGTATCVAIASSWSERRRLAHVARLPRLLTRARGGLGDGLVPVGVALLGAQLSGERVARGTLRRLRDECLLDGLELLASVCVNRRVLRVDLDQCVRQHSGDADAREPLPVGGDDVPRRPGGAGRRQHLGERLLVVAPVLPFLDVVRRELPVVVGEVDPPQEATALLLPRQVQEQLDDLHPVVAEIALPAVDLAVATLPDVGIPCLLRKPLSLEQLRMHAYDGHLFIM